MTKATHDKKCSNPTEDAKIGIFGPDVLFYGVCLENSAEKCPFCQSNFIYFLEKSRQNNFFFKNSANFCVYQKYNSSIYAVVVKLMGDDLD